MGELTRDEVESRARTQNVLRAKATATAVTAAGFLGLVAVLLPSSAAVASAATASTTRTSPATTSAVAPATSPRSNSLVAPFGARAASADTETSGN